MNAYFNDIVKNISQIIKFKSVQTPAKEGMPFGEEAFKSLQYFLSLAEFLGFKTKNYDGYVGEVVFGKGKPFAILAHLDVVPEGNGWSHDPYGGEIDYENSRVWGRGALDDKGPAIIALFALKALKDKGFKPKRTIKLIVGCNEETGWACIDHYNKVAKMPEEGFSPDADFPVIYAEKGICHLKFAFENKVGAKALKGGNLGNMVCDYCQVEQMDGVAIREDLGLILKDGLVISKGKSAHGSTPDQGINAIPPILKYLGLDDIYNMLFVDKCGVADLEDESGRLTFSPNIIEGTDDKIYITCDMRYPATLNGKDVLAKIESLGVPFEILHHQLPLFNDKNCKLIKTLLEVYNEETGKNAKPIAIGGGTYARALKCGAAFGPEEEGEECTVHQANEYITFEKIKKCFNMYQKAIERLCK